MTGTDSPQAAEHPAAEHDARSEGHGYDASPWWAGTGPLGACLLIVFGAVVAVWVFLRLPGTPENWAGAYLGAAKLVAIGLVLGGTALLNHFRTRSTAAAERNDDAPDAPADE